MPGTPSAIPVGTQFSPDLLDLHEFLKAIIKHSGNKAAMEKTVWKAPVRVAPPGKTPTRRRASLPLEAAVQYGLLTPGEYEATGLAHRLVKLCRDELRDEFARHILLELGGLRVVEACQQMRADGLRITGDTLAEYLTDQGFPVTVHNTAINSLRMWLADAGVFPRSSRSRAWDVSDGAKARLVGLDDAEIASLVGLNEEQHAFAKALCRINPSGRHLAADVRNLAEQILGRRLDRSSLPRNFLQPLHDAGFIEYESGGTGSGKSAVLWTTARFDAEVLGPFLEKATEQLDAVLTDYYRRAPEDIYTDLASTDKNVKGQALEAYAVHIMRLLGLRFVGWRKRAKDTTGQAEIDVVMAGTIGGLATRWQIQCKNTPSSRVDLEDVAKEVGLLPVTKATHVMVLANCPFTEDAVTYARKVMEHHPVTVFLLDDRDFERVKQNPGDIALILRARSEEVAAIQRQGLDWLR